jgi:hypothetical protein
MFGCIRSTNDEGLIIIVVDEGTLPSRMAYSFGWSGILFAI